MADEPEQEPVEAPPEPEPAPEPQPTTLAHRRSPRGVRETQERLRGLTRGRYK